LVNVPDPYFKESADLIRLLHESELCFSETTYRLPEGNLEVRKSFRCTNVRKHHSTDVVTVPHFSNKQLFSADASRADVVKWFTALLAFFGYGYYPRWEGRFQSHSKVITPKDLEAAFKTAIQEIFKMQSAEKCLDHTAMLLKSLTNNIEPRITKNEMHNGKLREIIYCSTCFKEGQQLCINCKKRWAGATIENEWKLKLDDEQR